MIDLNSFILLIISNAIVLSTRNKKQRSSDWLRCQSTTMCYLQESNFKYKKADRIKVKEF